MNAPVANLALRDPFARPWMTPELELLRSSTRRFLEEQGVPHTKHWEEQGHLDRDFWNKAGGMGLLCASIPEAYGGMGGDFRHESVIAEELGRAEVMLGNSVHSGIVAHYLLAYGSEEQKMKWLPKMASGEMVGAIAMSEPHAGSDLQAVRTRAVRSGDDYVINGSKIFITNGYLCDMVIVVCKTDPEKGAKGTSLIVVETKDCTGFKRGLPLEKVGQKGQDTCELFFDDVRVPVGNLLGEREGLGFIQLMQQLPQERLIIGIGACASMERVLEQTTAYVRERKVFGKALIEMQNTRFVLAECKTEAVVARNFVDSCMEKLLKHELDPATAAMSKWWTTEVQCRVIDRCLQMFGGYGYMTEYPIARAYANARVGKIYGGTNEVMKELIARSL